MNGLELSKQFFETYGQLIFNKHPEAAKRSAAGIAGHGSECFGFDDDISKDHDYCVGFTIWLNDEDEAKYGFELMKEYSKLPKEYKGISKSDTSLYGMNKYGVKTISSFLRHTIGISRLPLNEKEWFIIPEHSLACACNGAIFYDGNGEMTKIREYLTTGMPDDVYLKKLSAHLALCAQSGQYNYLRCINHGENAAAQLAAYEFVNHWMFCRFMLQGIYLPYYKWRFKALRRFDRDSASKLEHLICGNNSLDNSAEKPETIEDLCSIIISMLKSANLSQSDSDYLENHALSVQSKIKSPYFKEMHLMEYGSNE